MGLDVHHVNGRLEHYLCVPMTGASVLSFLAGFSVAIVRVWCMRLRVMQCTIARYGVLAGLAMILTAVVVKSRVAWSNKDRCMHLIQLRGIGPVESLSSGA